jgi:predicted metal-dependent enzyme (double-stranded beta helix superfamily)
LAYPIEAALDDATDGTREVVETCLMPDDCYTLEQFLADLGRVVTEESNEHAILARVAPLVQRVARDRAWLNGRHYEADPVQGFGSHVLYQAGDHSPFVTVVSWLPGRGAPPHDHGSWAVVVGVDGAEENTFWRRLDDGSKSGYANLDRVSTTDCREGDVLPMPSGTIHSVRNASDRTTLSFHVYGRPLNSTGRHQFDPEKHTESPFVVRFEKG